MSGAALYAVGSGQSGQNTQGVVAQYQADAIVGTSELSSTSIQPSGGPTGVTGYDSGNITGHVQPGGAGSKLVDGTIQRASSLICDATAGNVGNALVSTKGQGQAEPTKPAGQGKQYGLSSGSTLG